MTWKQKYAENKKLIELYMSFLTENIQAISMDEGLKLAAEIGRLVAQNKYIDEMTVMDFHNQCIISKIKQPSLLNEN